MKQIKLTKNTLFNIHQDMKNLIGNKYYTSYALNRMNNLKISKKIYIYISIWKENFKSRDKKLITNYPYTII